VGHGPVRRQLQTSRPFCWSLPPLFPGAGTKDQIRPRPVPDSIRCGPGLSEAAGDAQAALGGNGRKAYKPGRPVLTLISRDGPEGNSKPVPRVPSVPGGRHFAHGGPPGKEGRKTAVRR
jgi:hypothetical protein